MPFFASLPTDAGVRHILQLNKPAGRALIEFHQALLRGNSPLGPAQLELIAAYVSGLNACQYCYGVHSETAKAFGFEAGVLESVLANLDAAPVDPTMRPLLNYTKGAAKIYATRGRAHKDKGYAPLLALLQQSDSGAVSRESYRSASPPRARYISVSG